MGLEARCPVRVVDADGTERAALGTALLESDALIVRGEARVRVPRTAILDAVAHDGVLAVRWEGGALDLTLGAAAAKWLTRLREAPKPVVDKLDVKPGALVSAVGIEDADLLTQVEARAGRLVRGAVEPGSDVVLLGVTRAADLAAIAPAAAAMAERGALWAVHPRAVREVQDTAIFAAAAAAGLTYTKVARVSDTHTAEKLVRPRR
jgi:hypothetical protein